VLDYLASGMTPAEILADLTEEDLRACLALAADRERRLMGIPAEAGQRQLFLHYSDKF
jgi:hypothetical protein